MCQCNDKRNSRFQSKRPVVYCFDFIIDYCFFSIPGLKIDPGILVLSSCQFYQDRQSRC